MEQMPRSRSVRHLEKGRASSLQVRLREKPLKIPTSCRSQRFSLPQNRRVVADCTIPYLVRGRVLIRTVWLGLFLLVCIAALASFKLAFGAQQPIPMTNAAAFVAANADAAMASTSLAPDTLTKGDRLEVVYVKPTLATNAEPTALAPPGRSTIASPTITSRHWHDPSEQNAQVAARKSKVRTLKKISPVAQQKPTIEANSCKSNGLDPLHRLFNSSATCNGSN
jgi:hypothetical protein